MELNTLLQKRRSVRAYDPARAVEKETVEQIIAAAQEAPTWKNSQTGRYHVVMSPEKLAQFKAECLHPYNAKNVADAPVLIVATFVKNVSGFRRDGSRDTELGNEWGSYDLGLQNANLLLKAAELGLSTLIMGLRDADRIRTLLEIPAEETIVSVIGLGYASVDPQRPPRKPLDEVVRFY